jgi:hypothetical protein
MMAVLPQGPVLRQRTLGRSVDSPVIGCRAVLRQSRKPAITAPYPRCGFKRCRIGRLSTHSPRAYVDADAMTSGQQWQSTTILVTKTLPFDKATTSREQFVRVGGQ